MQIEREEWPLSKYSFKDSGKLFSIWFIHGETETTGDISDGDQYVLCSVPIEAANRIVTAHNAFVDAINDIRREYQNNLSTPTQANGV